MKNGKSGKNGKARAVPRRKENAHPEIVMSLSKYDAGDYITKAGLAAAFGCTGRTIQRMIERLDIPPPVFLAGRKVWIVGKLRAWIISSAQRQEEEALKAMGPLRAFDV